MSSSSSDDESDDDSQKVYPEGTVSNSMDADLWHAILRTAALLEAMGPRLAGEFTPNASWKALIYGVDPPVKKESLKDWIITNKALIQSIEALIQELNAFKETSTGKVEDAVKLITFLEGELKKAKELKETIEDEHKQWTTAYEQLAKNEEEHAKLTPQYEQALKANNDTSDEKAKKQTQKTLDTVSKKLQDNELQHDSLCLTWQKCQDGVFKSTDHGLVAKTVRDVKKLFGFT